MFLQNGIMKFVYQFYKLKNVLISSFFGHIYGRVFVKTGFLID